MGCRILVVDFVCFAVLVVATITFYSVPKVGRSFENLLTERCTYDTTVLCVDCFTKPANCTAFAGIITPDTNLSVITNQFNEHSVHMRFLNTPKEPIYNYYNLNRKFAIDSLLDSICEQLNVTVECAWRDNEQYIQILRQRVLSDNRTEGAMICPSWDERVLTRFVEKFDQKHLLTLMMMVTNSQYLMVRMLNQRSLPVPSFILQEGFVLAEYYKGEPLSGFYRSPLTLRLKIGNALIDAFIKFSEGAHDFKFYLPNLGPENIFVEVEITEAVEVTFVELSNVVIIDETNLVQTEDCANRYGDVDLRTACQLLLEDRLGDTAQGFLHHTELDIDLILMEKLLHQCVYCKGPKCRDRKLLLKGTHHAIASYLGKHHFL